MPYAIRTRLQVCQLKTQTTLTNNPKKGWLHLIEFSNVSQAPYLVKRGHFSWHLHFFVVVYELNHAKWQLLLVALLNEVEVADLKDLKMKLAIRKKAV